MNRSQLNIKKEGIISPNNMILRGQLISRENDKLKRKNETALLRKVFKI